MILKKYLSKLKQGIYHRLRLYQIYKVIKVINARYPLSGCSALEAFAFTGAWQARAYRRYPAYHEAWEIQAWCRPHLERNLPGANVRITDSFQEVQRCERKFNFINVDTHQGIFGPYCENFEFYPLLFRVAADELVVNLNVMPAASAAWRKKYPDLFSKQHLERRKEFYKPRDPENVSLEEMLRTYSAIALSHGYQVLWHHYSQRTLTWYLALHLKKVK